jgi:hypothetical protein
MLKISALPISLFSTIVCFKAHLSRKELFFYSFVFPTVSHLGSSLRGLAGRYSLTLSFFLGLQIPWKQE